MPPSRYVATALPDTSPQLALTIKTIVLATDLSVVSRDATLSAIDLSARLKARLLVVNVLERRRLSGSGSHDRMDQARAERETHLLAVVRKARSAGANAAFLLWDGDPGSSIVAAAEAEHADLVVVGTRGRSGPERMLLGSVSDHVVHHAVCAVMVVPPFARHASDPFASQAATLERDEP